MDLSSSTKKHRLVEKAIPNIANAIKTVVSLSKNDNFKGKCFNLVKVKDEDEFSKAITKRLWNIATSKLNVKSCDDEDSQIVPSIKPPVNEAKKNETVEHTAQNDALNEINREDYFDDLAGEISFYEDLCNQGNCPSKRDAVDPATCGKSFLAPEEHEVRQKSPSVNYVQELQPEKPERRHPLPVTKIMPDITSPKAKLRCCESTVPPTRKAVSSKDWLQEFTQDFFWMENDKTPAQKTLKDTLDCYAEEQVDETAHLSRLQSAFQGDTEGEDECTKKSQSVTDVTVSNNAINGKGSNNARLSPSTHHSKQQERESPSNDTLSQCTTSSGDFDALAELSFI
ncbi:hypothetical protein ACROYT_G042664 [Oculina patagonica]